MTGRRRQAGGQARAAQPARGREPAARIRDRIRARAERLRSEREAGRGWWASLTAALSDVDLEAAKAQKHRARMDAASDQLANHTFDRHGPSDRDRIPGGRFDTHRDLFARRRPEYWD